MKTLMVALPVLVCCSAYGFGGRVHIMVNVVDSMTGAPIPNMKVHGGFRNSSPGWGIASKDNSDEKVTGDDGMCRLSGSTEAGHSCCIVRNNDGYYDSGWYSFDYDERSFFSLGRWMPDNVVVTARLDRIVNPVPLYVGRSRSLRNMRDALDDGAVVAYDLLKNDWLPPWGNGDFGDMSFACKKTVLGEEPHRYPSGIHTNQFYRCDVRVTFPGKGNGMIESMPSKLAGIKLRVAPETGYYAERICWRGRMNRTEYKDNFDEDRCYYIRIRTEFDESGNVRKAIYGKIYGDFKLEDKKNGIKDVSFLYYLNPTPNDRNLEWDRKNNLCPKPGDIGGDPRP